MSEGSPKTANYGYGPEGGDLVEGVGDEVVVTYSTLLLLLVPVLIFAWQHRHRALQTIHPASVRLVEEARRLLGIRPSPPAPADPPTETDPPRRFGQDRQCPICFGEAQFAVYTNCGHPFCSNCLLVYWRHGNFFGPVQCPVCRRPVTLLLPNFAEAPDAEGRAAAANAINDYNRRFSGEARPWSDYLRDIPVLIPHIARRLFSFDGLMLMFRFRVVCCIIGAALYVLSPLDIIPEAVFGIIGLFDDFFVLLLFLLYVSTAYRQFLGQQA